MVISRIFRNKANPVSLYIDGLLVLNLYFNASRFVSRDYDGLASSQGSDIGALFMSIFAVLIRWFTGRIISIYEAKDDSTLDKKFRALIARPSSELASEVERYLRDKNQIIESSARTVSATIDFIQVCALLASAFSLGYVGANTKYESEHPDAYKVAFINAAASVGALVAYLIPSVCLFFMHNPQPEPGANAEAGSNPQPITVTSGDDSYQRLLTNQPSSVVAANR